MKKLALLAVVIAVAIFVMPKAPQHNSMNLNRIQADAKQTFPYNELIACGWFQEQADSPNSHLIEICATKFLEQVDTVN